MGYLRITNRNAVKRSIRYGDFLKTKHLQIRYIKNNTNSARIAVVVGKKVHKSAVVRNRLRRKIQEAIRKEGFFCKQNLDIVFFIKSREVDSLTYDEIIDELRQADDKLNIR